MAWPSWRLEMQKPVNLNEALASFDDVYSPRIVAHMNDYDVRVAHAKGEHVWHVHEETDEFFLVLDGRLDIAMRDAGAARPRSCFGRATRSSSPGEPSTSRLRRVGRSSCSSRRGHRPPGIAMRGKSPITWTAPPATT